MQMKHSTDVAELKAQAQRLLVEAQKLPPGDERAVALKCVGKHRNDAQTAWNLAESALAHTQEIESAKVNVRATKVVRAPYAD